MLKRDKMKLSLYPTLQPISLKERFIFYPGHIIDLELAAEIGKNLLERNKELEVMLKSSHHYLEEQSIKNEVKKLKYSICF